MRALQLKSFQSDPEVVDLPEPEPGPGQVVIKVGGAGACHSDLHVMREFAEGMAPWGPPFVLGHEAAGWVHRLGSGVKGLEPGEPVAVYGLLGCGHCKPCAAGADHDGGLGHLATQILGALTPATVIAVDTRESALALAREVGAAATVQAGEDAAAEVIDATGGARADVVLDFVGSAPTIALGAAVAKVGMDLVVVGAAAGQFTWNFYALPYEVSLTTSFWGTLPELHEVIALARQGRIKAHVQRFGLEDAMRAYQLMEQGQLSGRAVIVP